MAGLQRHLTRHISATIDICSSSHDVLDVDYCGCSGESQGHDCRWAAVLGIILALSRALVQEPGVAFDPELALLEVVAHTHYLPRHWRGRAHTREVHSNFQTLFPFKVTLLTSAGSACSLAGLHLESTVYQRDAATLVHFQGSSTVAPSHHLVH